MGSPSQTTFNGFGREPIMRKFHAVKSSSSIIGMKIFHNCFNKYCTISLLNQLPLTISKATSAATYLLGYT